MNIEFMKEEVKSNHVGRQKSIEIRIKESLQPFEIVIFFAMDDWVKLNVGGKIYFNFIS